MKSREGYTTGQMQFEKTLDEMFITRGYTKSDKTWDFPYFHSHAKTSTGEIVVFIDPNPKLSVNTVKDCMSFMNSIGVTHCIIIYMESATPIVRKNVETVTTTRIELFSQRELGYNVTKHSLVPVHCRASSTERAQMAQHSGKIAKLHKSDPVARFHGFRRGELVKITRKDKTVTFRVVI